MLVSVWLAMSSKFSVLHSCLLATAANVALCKIAHIQARKRFLISPGKVLNTTSCLMCRCSQSDIVWSEQACKTEFAEANVKVSVSTRRSRSLT